jgi:A/G-specific adenine glycosylase
VVDARLDSGAVLAWFEAEGRSLPWRQTRDPWAVLAAELMLQQTQVGRIVERWPPFLERFPDAGACASVPVGDVIEAWSGLGYNRRAVNLHRCARRVVADHGGRLPRDLGDLLALPGIGPYTARAVRVFAYELDDAVVDTNVARILARTTGRRLAARAAQDLADSLVPEGSGWPWNQALLDIGATHCRARAPRCSGCPLAPRCAWQVAGNPDPDPAVGSSGVSGRQSRFEGSDRQGRGRLVDALRTGPVDESDLAGVMGWPGDEDRAQRVAATVVADGLAECQGTRLVLTGRSASR